MKRLNDITSEQQAMQSVVGLTDVFEGLASMRIAQIKNQVLSSQSFFRELWGIYSQVRVSPNFTYGRGLEKPEIDKDLFIAITAEGGFSGDIDQKLIDWMLSMYDPSKHELIIVGHHGALQVSQAHIGFKRYFKMPLHDNNINVMPLINQVKRYKTTTVFYQTYVTLMVQDIKKIELKRAIEQASASHKKSVGQLISDDYIFEPSVESVASHLENTMMQITLTQTILDSKLAQYASRFRAMRRANDKASDMSSELKREYSHTKRFIADERTKEVLNGLMKMEQTS